MPRGKVLKIDVTSYHILDVMQDPAYMPHFARRYHIAIEAAAGTYVVRSPWYSYYLGKPRLLYDDCLEEVKRILGVQSSSASAFKLTGVIRKIVLDACSDWITEKTGRTPEFEIFPNTVKSARTNIEYYAYKINKTTKDGKTDPALNLGDTGTPPVREESDRGDDIDEILR